MDALSSGESVRDAIGSTWIIGTDLLAEVAWAVVIYGLVLLIGTVLAGPGGTPAASGRRSRRPSASDQFGVGRLAVVYLLLILWAPFPLSATGSGCSSSGAGRLGFEAFRRWSFAEAGPADTQRIEPPPRPAT